MNSLEAVLISQRVQYIVEKLLENFNLLWLADYQRIIALERLSTGRLSLEDETQIALFEDYVIEDYQLVIVRYAYIWYNRDGNELLRADNSEHHDVITSPHHLHDLRWKRERIKPFGGQRR